MLKGIWNMRRAMVLGAALLILAAMAILHAEAQTPPPLNGIAHVAIRVSNLTASREFYKQLGFAEAFALSRNGTVYESFIKINDKQFLELYPTDAKNTEIGFLHLCFEGADLNAIHDDYVSRGLTPKAVRTAGAGNLLFTMVGPENQNIEYTQYMPASMHSKDVGKDLGPERVGDKLVTVSLAMKDMKAARDFYLDKLLFTVAKKNSMLLNLPGTSGEHVEIASDELGHHARIWLSTPDIKKSEQELDELGIPVKKFEKKVLGITDPDGNQILIERQ